jgi:hypothetical protein
MVQDVECHCDCNVGYTRGRDSVDGVATGYGLDGSGVRNPVEGSFTHPFRPALRATQPPVQREWGLSRG